MNKTLKTITVFFKSEGLQAYLVGGAVRDSLIKAPGKINDLDFATEGNPLFYAPRIAKILKGSYFPLDVERRIGRIVIRKKGEPLTLDFSPLSGKSITEDLSQRDFTIDAMAIDLNTPKKILDPFSGQADIKKKIIRPVSLNVLNDDPLRMLRGIRLSSSLGFRLHRDFKTFLKAHPQLILTVAGERVRDEIFKILASPKSFLYIRELKRLNLMDTLFPELKDFSKLKTRWEVKIKLWDHSLNTLYFVEDFFSRLKKIFPDQADKFQKHLEREVEPGIRHIELLKFAALFHDLGKPDTKSKDEKGKIHFYEHEKVSVIKTREICQRLRLSKNSSETIERIIFHHMYPFHLSDHESISRRAFHRFFLRTDGRGPEIILLAFADAWATPIHDPDPEAESRRLNRFFSRMLKFYFQEFLKAKKKPILNGHDLISIGIKPGPELGRLLKMAEEEHAEKKFKNKKEALDFVKANLI